MEESTSTKKPKKTKVSKKGVATEAKRTKKPRKTNVDIILEGANTLS